MIKKLKYKFILNNILIFSFVICVVFLALCVLIYITEENKLTDVLENNMLMVQDTVPTLPPNGAKHDNLIYDVSFILLVHQNGEIISKTNDTPNDDELHRLIAVIVNSDYSRGNYPSKNISYLKRNTPHGILISVVSREHLETRIKEAVSQSAFVGFITLILFLYISKRIADKAIAPVERAWEQQKQFLADASHDLKTPITVILANNNIVASHRDETVESQMKWIESTNEEAGRMSDLINKMLELAKGEEAKEELKIGETDLSEVVENSILQFEVVAFEKNLTIESGIQPGIIVKTHRNTVSKVLEILFDNAVKYSKENGVISVALYQSSKKVFFTINNHGEHISEEDIPHIFERFYRTSKEREVGGHGLGLSIAKKKCDMIGVKLSVESSPEEGTTFTLTFKAKKK